MASRVKRTRSSASAILSCEGPKQVNRGLVGDRTRPRWGEHDQDADDLLGHAEWHHLLGRPIGQSNSRDVAAREGLHGSMANRRIETRCRLATDRLGPARPG